MWRTVVAVAVALVGIKITSDALAGESQKPSISGNPSREESLYSTFDVFWTPSEDKVTPNAPEGDIEICAPECSTRQMWASSNWTSVPINPGNPFTVNVTAVIKRSDTTQRVIILERSIDAIRFKVEPEIIGSNHTLQMIRSKTEMWRVGAPAALILGQKSTGSVRISAHFCFDVANPEGNHCEVSRNSADTDAEASVPPLSLGIRQTRSGCLEFRKDEVTESGNTTRQYEIKVRKGAEIHKETLDTELRVCHGQISEIRADEIVIPDRPFFDPISLLLFVMLISFISAMCCAVCFRRLLHKKQPTVGNVITEEVVPLQQLGAPLVFDPTIQIQDSSEDGMTEQGSLAQPSESSSLRTDQGRGPEAAGQGPSTREAGTSPMSRMTNTSGTPSSDDQALRETSC